MFSDPALSKQGESGAGTIEGAEPLEGEVGVDEGRQDGLSLGVAPAGSKPVNLDKDDEDLDGEGSPGKADSIRKKKTATSASSLLDDLASVPDKQSAFLDWKVRQGASYESHFQDQKAVLSQKKRRCKAIIEALNERKKRVDELQERLSAKQAEQALSGERGGAGDYIDEEEYRYVNCCVNYIDQNIMNLYKKEHLLRPFSTMKLRTLRKMKLQIANMRLTLYNDISNQCINSLNLN